MQLSIFLLETGEQKIIKCPKFANPNTYSLRPGSGHLATILKIDAADLLTVHELGSYEAITTAALPTVDAQGLKWSPSGAWLAVWDAASAGTKVAIFTADGLLFRTYVMDSEMASSDFGVRCIEWSPDSSWLAVGKHDGTVDLIDGRTVGSLRTLFENEMLIGWLVHSHTYSPRSPISKAHRKRHLHRTSLNPSFRDGIRPGPGIPSIPIHIQRPQFQPRHLLDLV